MQRLAWWLIAVGMTINGSRDVAAAENRSTPNLRVWPKLLHGAWDLFAGRYNSAIAEADAILQRDANNLRAYVLRGYAHLFTKGDARKAVADFTEALRCDPGNSVLLVARAQAYQKANDGDRAIADCTEAIRTVPTYGEAYAWRAGCYLEKRVTGKAIADYTIALRHSPHLAWARCGRGEAYRRSSEAVRALDDLEEVLCRDPSNEQALYNRCFVYLMNLRDCDRVIAESSERIRLCPREPCWYFLRGMAYLPKGEITKGLCDAVKAVILRPEYFHSRLCRKAQGLCFVFGFGPLRFALGCSSNRTCFAFEPCVYDPDERIAACTKRIAIDPNNVAAYYERAYAYKEKHDFSRAEADFSEIIRLDPKDAEAFRARAYVRFYIGVYTGAIMDYECAMQRDPNNADDFAGRARIYGAKKRYEEAIQDCNKAIQLDPHSGFAYSIRASLHSMRHEYDEAITDYSEAIRCRPGDGAAFFGRIDARARKGDYPGMIADAKAILKRDPSNPMALSLLAWFLSTCPDAALRDGPEAKKLAAKACETTSWRDKVALSSLAAACAECGEFEQAVKWQTKAVELVPEKGKDEERMFLELYKAHKSFHVSAKKG